VRDEKEPMIWGSGLCGAKPMLHPFHRRPLRWAGDAHYPALSLDDKIVAGTVFIRPILTITSYRTVDDTRIDLTYLFITQTPTLHRAREKVLHQNIAFFDELAEYLPTLLGFEIEGDALLVAVDGEIISALTTCPRRPPLTRAIALAGNLNLDDFGSQVAQEHRAIWACQDAGEVYHHYIGKRTFSHRFSFPENHLLNRR